MNNIIDTMNSYSLKIQAFADEILQVRGKGIKLQYHNYIFNMRNSRSQNLTSIN